MEGSNLAFAKSEFGASRNRFETMLAVSNESAPFCILQGDTHVKFVVDNTILYSNYCYPPVKIFSEKKPLNKEKENVQILLLVDL